MRKRLATSLLVLAGLFSTGTVRAAEDRISARESGEPQGQVSLHIGDAAPPLKTGAWIKGEPVSQFESGKVYVVEFWSIGCPGCIAGIPHLSHLQAKYPQVTLISQNCMQPRGEQFLEHVKNLTTHMNYRVVLDDVAEQTEQEREAIKKLGPNALLGTSGTMEKTWKDAAGKVGVPYAFVVDKGGKIAWIGFPNEIEDVLKKVLDGTWSTESQIQAETKVIASRKSLADAYNAKDYATALKHVREINSTLQYGSPTYLAMEARILLKNGNVDEVEKFVKVVSEKYNDNDEILGSVASSLTNKKYDEDLLHVDLAEKLLLRANELTHYESSGHLASLAHILFTKGEKAKAIELQSKAVDNMLEGGIKKAFKNNLEYYKSNSK